MLFLATSILLLFCQSNKESISLMYSKKIKLVYNKHFTYLKLLKTISPLTILVISLKYNSKLKYHKFFVQLKKKFVSC